MIRIEALVLQENCNAVRHILRHNGWEWTESPATGGWSGHRYTRFWLMVPETDRDAIIQTIHDAAPSRMALYHPRQSWDLATWFHPTHITIQGAVITWWPVTMEHAVVTPSVAENLS